MSKILVTGAAGFIGFYVSQRLCKLGHQVLGIDNLNDYYDINLKHARLALLKTEQNFQFQTLDLADRSGIAGLFKQQKFDRVIHLGAQAGVRYSIDNPMAYIDSNLVGHATILEGCRNTDVEHLVYASSSSVYGMDSAMPFSTSAAVDHPVSLYAATKKSNELMAHSYSHLYQLPTTGLRFFTVYGPWGRPDMAPMKFTKAILKGETIDIYNNGEMSRDFTYIDDIVEGIIRIQDIPPSHTNNTPYKIYNIGNGSPVKLMDFIAQLETSLGIESKKNFMPMQPGDVYSTYADTKDFFETTQYTPKTGIQEGTKKMVSWYREFYQKK